MTVRTGIGYDVHRFAPSRALILGGVTIPHELGLEGHSDADVLIHAISDAILGAAALGDIGLYFPPTDAALETMSSRDILRKAVDLVADQSLRVVNIDSTVVAEAPRIRPFVDQMRESLAELVQIPVANVGVKATTNEGMGFVGRQEGIAALAIATLTTVGALE